MNINSYLPTIVRYAIVSLMAAMFTHGWLSPEHNAILGENLDIIVSALVGLLTVVWAMVKRPSAKAMEAAKEIDAQIPANQDVVILTPGSAPDITVSAPGQK
ncbi:hypothetical protein [Rhizobium sp. Root483D2]|uniref:Pam3-gp28 family putative phage holin n=1 Tax=Rhizobium sp. Root483D2 TaxID=1736545 RepID=UPI000715B37F|nr:hypothetical protein [Rhizobium sp. Root483D2]KQY20214.1 hypothetical protein ASD32_07035 [Rhizobium sp. Root483D2]